VLIVESLAEIALSAIWALRCQAVLGRAIPTGVRKRFPDEGVRWISNWERWLVQCLPVGEGS